MLVITLIWPPQRSQTSMSSPDGAPQGSCRANRYRLVQRYLNTMLAIRREDTVEAAEIDSWLGRPHPCAGKSPRGQPLDCWCLPCPPVLARFAG